VLTSTGTQGEANAEANLLFNGSLLSVNGSISGNTLIFNETSDSDNGGIFYPINDRLELSAITHIGEIIELNFDIPLEAGKVYCLTGVTSGTSSQNGWVLSNATNESKSTGLLGIAIENSQGNNNFMIRGFISVPISAITGTYTVGNPIVLDTSNGFMSFTKPSSNGNIIRIIGYLMDVVFSGRSPIYYKVYFNPSNDWIEL
jgi:hypothetical protein